MQVQQEQQRQATQKEADRRAAAEKERRDTLARAAEESAKSHRDECAASFRGRFLQFQKDAAEYATLRPQMTARCKELAKHCSTSSSGQSYCHGLTGQEHQAFDQWCSGSPVAMTTEESESCADVDPEHLAMDTSWSAQDALALSKRKPPAAVPATDVTASDSTPRTR